MKIINTVAVITGGASGLGEAAARMLRENGSLVAIWDSNLDRGQKVASEIDAFFCHVDVTDNLSVEKAIKDTLEKYGKINILLNSAGIFEYELILNQGSLHSLEKFEKTINVNLFGTFNVTRLVCQAMIKQEMIDAERGVIVNISSIAAFSGIRGMTSYSASKSALVGMTLPMARDLQNTKIRVVTIAPGTFTNTNIQGNPTQDVIDVLKDGIACGRGGLNEEFAHCFKFVIENQYLNGVTIELNGGYIMPNL